MVHAALDAWEHARVVEVKLPIGGTVRYEMPDFQYWLSRGTIPNPLAAIAARVEYQGVTLQELRSEPDTRVEMFELMCWTVGAHLKDPDLVALTGSPEAAAEYVASTMPPADREELWRTSLHMLSPGTAMADLEEALAPLMALGDLAGFRDGGAGQDVPVGSGGDGKGA